MARDGQVADVRTVLRTTHEELKRISKERGREFDAEKHTCWCGECGAPIGAFGIMHWQDCVGDESMIRFRELDD
jgi:hypothetical protein